ncbi:hypothetical protein [Modestobacter sp. SSW1-42]|uniref:hypothetical protein n=1 Tax=Modestobacter sp. SSW1-42 TaxID=596372 RepID=UPI0039883B78
MALLWDLDNVTAGRAHIQSLAKALSSFVQPGAPRIAAARRSTYRLTREPLASAGIRLLSGGRQRDGADRILIQQAQALNAMGVRTFYVASNDHRFQRIADFAALHVLTLDGTPTSQRLHQRARTVTALTRDDDGHWRRRRRSPRRDQLRL